MWLPNLLKQPVGSTVTPEQVKAQQTYSKQAMSLLKELAAKGRATKTGYTRAQFGDGWGMVGTCDVRNVILARDMVQTEISSDCLVLTGTLNDPYTAKKILFKRGALTSPLVQIDHVVALSDAWQKGAQLLSYSRRVQFANDPLNLLAVDGQSNQDKSDGDAATWLPPNKPFRCQYVSRQVQVKQKYLLWVTQAEKDAIQRVLLSCI